MKALQRDNEIIPEPWDQWTLDHLEWLTTPRPDGDGYVLIEDYEPETDGSDMEAEPIPEAPAEEQAQEPDPVPEVPAEDSGEGPAEDPEETAEPGTEALPDDDEIVVLNGVQYTKAQLRALLEGSQ